MPIGDDAMPMIYADLPFVLAVLAFGWGLSLATYRMFATRYDWPMGVWQNHRPGLPILIGLVAVAFACMFALARGMSGAVYGGWAIVAFGVLVAVLWTAFLRVGSQMSLLLAPVASVLLFVSWFGGPDALEYRTVRSEVRELRQLLEDNGILNQRRDDRTGPVVPAIPRKDRTN